MDRPSDRRSNQIATQLSLTINATTRHYCDLAHRDRYCSISAFDRGDDYDEYGVCIAYIYHHPQGLSMYVKDEWAKESVVCWL